MTTDRGNFVLRGNDIRFVLRKPGGEILKSTYFSVETTPAPDGSLARLTLHGMGYGHGVGMCQWGAIGRARAGQDFRDDSPDLLSGHRDRAGAVAPRSRGHSRLLSVCAHSRRATHGAGQRIRSSTSTSCRSSRSARRSAGSCRRRSSRRTCTPRRPTTARSARSGTVVFGELLGVALSRRRRAARSWTRSNKSLTDTSARIQAVAHRRRSTSRSAATRATRPSPAACSSRSRSRRRGARGQRRRKADQGHVRRALARRHRVRASTAPRGSASRISRSVGVEGLVRGDLVSGLRSAQARAGATYYFGRIRGM